MLQPGELAIDRRGLRIVLKSRGDVGVDCGTCNLGHLLASEERAQVLLDSPFELLRVASIRLVVVDQVVARFVVLQSSNLRGDRNALRGVALA